MRKVSKIFALVSFMALNSCVDVECGNTNPIFDNYSPEDRIYRDALIKELQSADNSNLYFFMDKYVVVNEQEYLSISIKSKSLCATGNFSIKKSDRIFDGIRRAKGQGYRGSLFKNLKYAVEGNQLVIKSLDAIVD